MAAGASAYERSAEAVTAIPLPMHGMHPMIVHFPIVAIVLAVGCDLWGWRTSLDRWRATATLSWAVALVGAVAALASGWLAYNAVEHSERSHALMLVHRNVAIGLTALLVLIVGLRFKSQWSLARVIGVGALIGVIVVGDRGAQLVFEHAMGLPTARLHAIFTERGGSEPVGSTLPGRTSELMVSPTAQDSLPVRASDGHMHSH